MDIAVTGASGFVGAALVQLHVRRGDSVRILARNPQAVASRFPSVHVIPGDLTAAEAIPKEFVAHADVLYHCAAEKYDERKMHSTNVEGTRALARRAAGRVGRWVQMSSVSVYGAVRSGSIAEDSPIQPDSLYGRTKAESEAVVAAEAAVAGYGVSIVRPAPIFSSQATNNSLLKLFGAIERGWFCFIGPPQAVMNTVHVENVASALALCGTSNAAAGRIYNISESISIEQLVAVVADELGVSCPKLRLPESPLRVLASVFGRIPGNPLVHRNLDALTQRASYSANRIARDLAYNPPVTLEAGLRELARNWKQTR